MKLVVLFLCDCYASTLLKVDKKHQLEGGCCDLHDMRGSALIQIPNLTHHLRLPLK